MELAKGLGDDVALVFGYSPPGIWGGEIAEHEEAIEEFGEKLMGEAREQVQTDGVEVSYELVPKRGAEALLDVARQRRCADDRRRRGGRGAFERRDPRLDALQVAASDRSAGARGSCVVEMKGAGSPSP